MPSSRPPAATAAWARGASRCRPRPGDTLRVPADQADDPGCRGRRGRPGDLVLVAPGDYHEAVLVTTPYLTIRGEDRNTVILDGDFTKPNGIHVVEADGVAVENMTARHFGLNGFYWAGVNGYRGSYLTAYGNGDYGVYAFDSVWGRFDHTTRPATRIRASTSASASRATPSSATSSRCTTRSATRARTPAATSRS